MPRGESLDWRNELPTDMVVRIDPDDFGEVVGNLLDNARKWANARVVGPRREGGRRPATIAVLDDGPGFAAGPPDPRSARVSRTPGAGSTGLGLGIVHDILSEYGVALQIGQEEGLCSVAFSLPAGAVVDDGARARPGGGGTTPNPLPGAAENRLMVLAPV